MTSASLQDAKKEYIMAILCAPRGSLQIKNFSLPTVPEWSHSHNLYLKFIFLAQFYSELVTHFKQENST